LQLKETGDCVSSATINSLIQQNKISTSLKTQIQGFQPKENH